MSVTQTEIEKPKPVTKAIDLYKKFNSEITKLSETNPTNRQFLIGLNRADVILWNIAISGSAQTPPQTTEIEKSWIADLRQDNYSIRELAAIFDRSTETIHHVLKEKGLTGLQETVEPAS